MREIIKRDLKGQYNNFNRVEILDKADVLEKLEHCLDNDLNNNNYSYYSYINKEIFITRKSNAKLYLYDNQKKHVYALPLDLYGKVLKLVDVALDLYY